METKCRIACGLAHAAILLTPILASSAAQAMLNISSKKTQNVDCNEGLCTPTASDAVLNVKDVTNLLSASDLEILANSPAVNIKITAPFSWTSKHRLNLTAARSVIVGATVVAAGRSGLTIATNTSGEGGGLTFTGGGSISLWDLRSSLSINGNSYTLVDDLRILVNDIATNPSGLYALAKSYDASQAGSYSHSPIPTLFSGRLEGLGNAIENLSIDDSTSDSEVGLFSDLEAAGTISGLVLSNLSLHYTGNVGNAGGIAGISRGKITNVSVSGAISGGYYTGGIVGENDGSLISCQVDVAVSEVVKVGGGAVGNMTGTASDCHTSGSVGAYGDAGGLVGLSSGNIDTSSSSSSVSVTCCQAGGLVGVLSSGNITTSFATGMVTNTPADGFHLGGLVGLSSGSISDSYAAATVMGTSSRGRRSTVGGLIGQSNGINGRVYSVSPVSLKNGYIGGVLGYDSSALRSNYNAFWDLETSGVDDPGKGAGNVIFDRGIKGLTDQQMHKLPKGFSPSVWAVNAEINNGYPYLIGNPPPK